MLLRLISSALLVSLANGQTTWFVDAAGTPPGSGSQADPYTSIQFALSQGAVVDGDTVSVADGTYAESIDFLGKDVTVAGAGPGRPEIIGAPGQDVSTVVFRNREGLGAVLEGVEVTGDVGTDVGGFRYGGGILIEGASPTLRDVTITESGSRSGGGLAVLSGRVRMIDCLLDGNTAWRQGAGVFASDGAVSMVGTTLSNNATGFERGGGFFGDGSSSLLMEDSVASFNSAGAGAGIYSRGTVTLNNVTLLFNEILDGYTGTGGGANVTSCTATGCTVRGNGGLVCLRGAGAAGGLWIDSEFRSNYGECFGAGLSGGQARGCLFLNNSSGALQGDVPSPPGGGAAFSTLIDCQIIQNFADADGGGTYECNLVDCVVRGNTGGWRNFGSGGGVSGGTALRCLIEDNRSGHSFIDGFGGGASDADLTLCVLRGNVAPMAAAAVGGTLDRCTVINNACGDLASSAIVGATLTSSIVWGNGPVAIDAATVVSYSAIEGGAPGVGNITAPPGFYGPGSDINLGVSSPCIDAGDPAAPLDPNGTRADMGALPFDPQWVTAGGAYCLESFPLTLIAPVSATQPGGAIRSMGAVQVFLLSTTNEPGLTVFPGASIFDRPSTLCLTGRIIRVQPMQPGVLSLGPAELAAIGLVAGDRLFVQGWSATNGFTVALDVIVQP